MTEDKKQDENKTEPQSTDDSNKIVKVLVRVPKDILDAYDKDVPEKGRNKSIVEMMTKKATEGGNGEAVAAASYEKLAKEAEDVRRDMERIKKALGPRLQAIRRVALTNLAETPENIPKIIKLIDRYEIKERDGFTHLHRLDYIRFLEQTLNHSKLEGKIKPFKDAKYKDVDLGNSQIETGSTKGKSKKDQPRRYIPPEQRCWCGRNETRAEHNRRCYHVLDEMRHGVNLGNIYTGTPEGQLKMIRDYGEEHSTSAEEKQMIIDYLNKQGTKRQKILVNQYFESHNYPAPFPELNDERSTDDSEAEEPEESSD